MLTPHPTLLIGPSDWQPQRMPKEEFLRRIHSLWDPAPLASHAIVFGSPAHHAELAYFTNLVPKLEPAVALLTHSGQHRLFVGGGANMLDAARPLSWIADMAPLGSLAATLKQQAMTSPARLIGSGYMTSAMERTVLDALGTPPQDHTANAWALMRHKTRFEIDAIRAACAALDGAMAAMRDALRSGAGVTDVVLEGERAANEAGAQDVRTLFSLNGGRTLAPFTTPMRDIVDPLQIYMAVRRFNYWADGFAVLSSRPHAAAADAAAALGAVLAAIGPGTRVDAVATMIEGAIAPFRSHPMTAHIANCIGLALEEPPYTDAAVFAADEVYSLKVGISDAVHGRAIVSAMVAVNEDGGNLLWQSPTPR